jgi:hypothetical protein
MAGGRPTVYKPENAEIARHACTLGASNETLAERFEVSRRTIDNWIATIPEFGDAVRHGREVADDSVVAALYARATGMERKSIKVVEGEGAPVTTTHTVQSLPDVRACMFWLRNRRPAQWRENRALGDTPYGGRDLAKEIEEGEERVRRWQEDERAKAERVRSEVEGAARSAADAVLQSQAERLQVYP